MQHTPGPWHADKIQDRSAYNIFQHGRTYSIATISAEGHPGRNVMADARLIAAAPALLENLRQLCELLESIGHDCTPAREAIKQATQGA